MATRLQARHSHRFRRFRSLAAMEHSLPLALASVVADRLVGLDLGLDLGLCLWLDRGLSLDRGTWP